jgi:restriction system protein
MMRSLLVLLEDGQERTSEEIRTALASQFSMTLANLAERTARGPHTRFVNLVAWALHHLSRACLVERRRPSVYRSTERGRRVLAAHPTTGVRAVRRVAPIESARATRKRKDRFSAVAGEPG